MATLRQRTSFGPGIYRGHKFDLDRLRSFVDGTNRAIAAGVPIPLLLRHAPINADDKATQTFASEPDKGAGFITKVELDSDGSIAWEAEAPTAIVTAAKEGALRYTSPEFRSHYECEKAGVYSGPVIRHFAFTPTPGNPHQGAIESVALAEEVWQFEESDVIPFAERVDDTYKGTFVKPTHDDPHAYGKSTGKSIDWDTLTPDIKSKILDSIKAGNNIAKLQELFSISGACAECGIAEYKKFKERNGMSQHTEIPSGHCLVIPTQYDEIPIDKRKGIDNKEDDVEVNKPGEGDVNLEVAQESMGDQPNPDMPPKATDKSKLAAIIAGLKQRGMVVPSDWDPDKEGAMDILLATLNTAIEAENKAKAEESEEDDDDENVTDAPMPFAENEPTTVHLMQKHGYKYTGGGGGKSGSFMSYLHPSGHSANLYGDGSWVHHSNEGKTTKSQRGQKGGKGFQSLTDHLSSFHGSQHTETKPIEEEDDDENVTDAPMPFSEEDHAKGEYGGSNVKTKNSAFKNLVKKHKGYTSSSGIYGASSFQVPKANLEKFHKAAHENGFFHPHTYKMDKDEHGPSKQYAEQPTVGDYVMQFTEEELASMPASLKAKLDAEASARKAAEAKAAQFEEANKTSVNAAAKDKAIAFIEASKLPSGMKVELLAAYDTCQFEEGIESPVYTNVQVAELFSKYIPKHLQFDEDDEDIVEGATPKGVHAQFFEGDTPTGHVSAERALELVNSNPFLNNRMTQQAKPMQGISDLVDAENNRVPNNVRGKGL